MGDLEAYTRRVGTDAFKAHFRRGKKRVVIGEYEGLMATGPARLLPRRRESYTHHRGYLAGHLTRWLCERGWPVDARITIAFAYAATLAWWWPEKSAAKADPEIRGHITAVLSTEKKVGRPLTDREERMVFAWLCEQAGVDVTPARVARLERLRTKRLSREA